MTDAQRPVSLILIAIGGGPDAVKRACSAVPRAALIAQETITLGDLVDTEARQLTCVQLERSIHLAIRNGALPPEPKPRPEE